MMLVLVGSDGVIMIFVFVEIHYWKLPELATHVGVDNGGEGAAVLCSGVGDELLLSSRGFNSAES